jgi:hypothetical protein
MEICSWPRRENKFEEEKIFLDVCRGFWEDAERNALPFLVGKVKVGNGFMILGFAKSFFWLTQKIITLFGKTNYRKCQREIMKKTKTIVWVELIGAEETMNFDFICQC